MTSYDNFVFNKAINRKQSIHAATVYINSSDIEANKKRREWNNWIEKAREYRLKYRNNPK
jgi:GTPase SAR1 family protein